MKKQRALLFVLIVMIVAGMAEPALAAAAPQAQPSASRHAGNVTALLPTAKIVRGTGRRQTIVDAKKGDEVVWDDTVRTEKGGRARITLSDQSILSIGSQSELRIVKHDARTQQTALQLAYGRVRSQVARVTREGGGFELRTPTAVAGVIGTDYGTEGSPFSTTFVCISGIVSVSSSNPEITGNATCGPGQTVTATNEGLSPVQAASPEQIQKVIEDTEPAIITALSPNSALVGTTITVNASGSHLNGVNSLAIDGGGVAGRINSTTGDAANITLTVAADAAPGPRTIHFNKPNGAGGASVFTVLALPVETGQQTGDPKQPYRDLYNTLLGNANAGLAAFFLGVDQLAGQTLQGLEQANSALSPPISLDQANTAINAAKSSVQTAITDGQNANSQATRQAITNFEQRYDSARAALLQRDPSGNPDDTFRRAVKTAFDEVHAGLIGAFNSNYRNVGIAAMQSMNAINAAGQSWMAQINAAGRQQGQGGLGQGGGVQAAVNPAEGSTEVGNLLRFDGNNSRGQANAGIATYEWKLCAQHPTQGNVDPNSSCSLVGNNLFTGAQIELPTCSLNPGEYTLRLIVTDTNNIKGATDVLVRIAQSSFPGPSDVIRNLASEYQSLQVARVMTYFSDNYPARSTLEENIRRTFQDVVASYNINPRISSETISCDQATVLVDWDQTYTLKGDAPGAPAQESVSQLRATLTRESGHPWMVTLLSGYTGSLPAATGTAAPGPTAPQDEAKGDLAVTDLVKQGGPAGNAIRIAVRALRLPGAGPSEATVPVAPGPNTFIATVHNKGNADITQAAVVRFTLTSGGAVLLTQEVTLPAIIAQGASVSASTVIDIPAIPPGTLAQLTAEVNPGCQIPEATCPEATNNLFPLDLVIGTVDLLVTGVTGTNLIGTLPGVINVTIKNQDTGASLVEPNKLKLSAPGMTDVLATIPAVGPGASVTIPVSVPALPNANGPVVFTATILPGVQGEINTANNVGTGTLTVSLGVDVQVLSLSAGTLIGTTNGAVSVVVKNLGGAPSAAGTLKVLQGPTVLGTASIPALAAGAQTTIPVTVLVPNVVGAQQWTAAISPAITNDVNAANDNVLGSVNVLQGVDIRVTSFTFNNALVGLQTVIMTATIENLGAATSPATTGNLKFFSPDMNLVFGTTNIPAIGPAGSTQVTISFVVPNQGGSHQFTVETNPANPLDLTPANNAATLAASISAATVDLSIVNLTFINPQPPFKANDLVGATFDLHNTGNSASAVGTYTCTLTGANPAQLTSGGINSIPAGGNVLGQQISFTIPANHTGSRTIDCAISTDPLDTNTANNLVSVAAQVNTTANLQVFALNMPSASQMGSTINVPVQVKNVGADDITGTNWNLRLFIGGSQIYDQPAGQGVPAGSTITLNAIVVVPSTAPAPVKDSTTGQAELNTTQAVVESNFTDNSSTVPIDLYDFTLSTIPTGPQFGVVNRSMKVPAVIVNPNTYPLPPGPPNLAISYTNSPAGMAPTGTYGGNVQGTPIATGSFNVTPSANADGVNRVGSAFTVDIRPEMAFTQTASPVLTAGNPTPQPLTLAVSGGILPVTVTLVLPTGVLTADPLSVPVTADGQQVTWNLTADNTAATGTNLPATVTLTDAGEPATFTPAGNVSLPALYTVNGTANYRITAVRYLGATAPYTGTNAIQKDSGHEVEVDVLNDGTESPTGNVDVNIDCHTCEAVLQTGSHVAPAAGQTVTVFMSDIVFNFGEGAFTAFANIVNAPPQTNTGDDTFPADFQVADFTVNPYPQALTIQNVPVGGSAFVGFVLGGSYTGAVPMTGTTATANVTADPITNATNGEPDFANFHIGAGVPSGTTGSFEVTGKREFVTRVLSQPVHYFTTALENKSDPTNPFTNNAANPIHIPNGNLSTISFRFSGDFDTSAFPAFISFPNLPAGIYPQPSAGTFNANPYDDFTIDVHAIAAQVGQLLVLPVEIIIPNTIPLVKATYAINLIVDPVPDLKVVSIVAGNGRSDDFSTNPWLSGEPVTWDVQIQNGGDGPSTGGERITIFEETRQVAVDMSLPALQPGTSYTAHIKVIGDDPFFTGSMSLYATVDPSTGEYNLADNSLSRLLETSDWTLNIAVGQPGQNVNRLPLTVGGPSGSTQVQLATGLGNFVATVNLQAGAASTGASVVGGVFTPNTLSSTTTTSSFDVQLATGSQTGDHYVQVFALMKDGPTTTAIRQTTVHIDGGTVNDTPILTASHPTVDGDLQNLELQLNGPLAETVTIQVDSTLCTGPPCTGAVDLHFSDLSQNVDANPSVIHGFVYATTAPVDFGAVIGAGGMITTGSQTVQVSATAVQAGGNAVRTPPPDPTGSNQYTLHFHVSDLDAFATNSCILLPPGGQPVTFDVDWAPSDLNFNVQDLNWQWTLPTGVTITGNAQSGVSSLTGGVYPPITGVQFTNTNANGIDGANEAVLAVTIDNSDHTKQATKFFPVAVDLSAGGNRCGGAQHAMRTAPAALRTGGGNGAGGTRLQGEWRLGRPAAMATTGSGQAVLRKPDVQIEGSDVSFTPSMPKAGDTVQLRFRLKNAGDADARGVTVGLRINGQIVASDTFDVVIGKSTLAGLEWNSAENPLRGTETAVVGNALRNAELVVDPLNAMPQKSTANKTAALRHFTAPGSTGSAGDAIAGGIGGGSSMQRVVLESAEGGCIGFRFSSGQGVPCGSGDIEITFDDIANRQFSITGLNGVASLGVVWGTPNLATAKYNSSAILVSGQSYAIQLGGGKIGYIKIGRVHASPVRAGQRAIDRNQADRLLRGMAGDTAVVTTGDVSGSQSAGSVPKVTIELIYQAP